MAYLIICAGKKIRALGDPDGEWQSCLWVVARRRRKVPCCIPQRCGQPQDLCRRYSALRRENCLFRVNTVRPASLSKRTKMDHCPNEGCKKEFSCKELEEHLERCAFRTTRCSLCEVEVVLSLLLEHCSKECPKRSVICRTCSAVLFAEETQEHYKSCCVVDGKKSSSAPVGSGAKKKKAKNESKDTDPEIKELRKLLNAARREIAELKLTQSIQERKTAALLRRTGPSYVWCLEPYRRLRQSAITHREDCLSDPIFFGLPGCKFRLQANLYGVGGGTSTHLAFFVQFKVADVARMSSCCIKKTRCLIRVASQRDGVDHVDHTFEFCASGEDRRRSSSRPLHMWNTLFGRDKFIRFEDLEDKRTGYVVDDLLILEFHVID